MSAAARRLAADATSPGLFKMYRSIGRLAKRSIRSYAEINGFEVNLLSRSF
jgi:hypothetical protein